MTPHRPRAPEAAPARSPGSGRVGGPLHVAPDDLSSASARALVALHLEHMRSTTPRGHVFALDAADLLRPDISVFSATIGGERVGMAALRDLGGGLGELKSMRTHPAHLRRGVAAALLVRILEEARTAGMRRVALETGRGPAFEPALALYRKFQFRPCGAFGSYVASPFNQFLDLDVGGASSSGPGPCDQEP